MEESTVNRIAGPLAEGICPLCRTELACEDNVARIIDGGRVVEERVIPEINGTCPCCRRRWFLDTATLAFAQTQTPEDYEARFRCEHWREEERREIAYWKSGGHNARSRGGGD